MAFDSELRDWEQGTPVVPVTLEIQPTERCNHCCPDCQARYSISLHEVRFRAGDGEHLDLNLLESIWKLPPRGIVISGNTGDPLLHPEIHTLLSIVGVQRLPTAMITNGEALTERLARLAVSVCRGIRISLDAEDAERFRRTHGVQKDSWDRILQSIRLLIKARTKARRTAQDCLIGVGYLTDQSTRAGMIPATRLARSLGVDYIQFRPFHYRVTDITQELRQCRQFETKDFRVLASYQKYSLLRNTSRSYTQCHGANFYSVLDARGNFYMCCHHVGDPSAKLGSLKTESWSEFVNSFHRRDQIANFPISDCVPVCRLHPHNEVLEKIKNDALGEIKVYLPKSLQYHAPFL